MKRLLTFSAIALCSIAANAISLFPFFADVAGDYHDGTMPELAAVGIHTMYWQTPSFYKTIREADAFLNNTLPYSSETITRDEIDLGKSKAVVFTSPMAEGKTSVIYLLQLPDNTFVAAYDEVLVSSLH